MYHMKTSSNKVTAQLITLHDCVWQLGNALRDLKSKIRTISETNPQLGLSREIDQAQHTLEKYAKGPMEYKPHPFGWEFDAFVKRDSSKKDRASDKAKCQILGCGRFSVAAEMRIYRIGGQPFRCCDQCWVAMELPDDCRDTDRLTELRKNT